MKAILRRVLFGILLGSVMFALTGIVFDVVNAGRFALENWSYTKMAIGAMVVGIGFSVPSGVYDNEKLAFGMQALIHMGIGCLVYLVTAWLVGWIPVGMGWPAVVLTILGQLLVAFLIWMGFVLHYKRLASRMSAKIREKQRP